MPYLPPEGFFPYPGSHLYYRSENGTDPQTGAPCQWVTYFDPNEGKYHQVAYPLPEPVPEPIPDPVPEPIPDPVPEPIPDPVPEPVPEPIPESVPEPAPAPESAPANPEQPRPPVTPPPAPPPSKKGKGGLIVVLLIVLVFVAGVLVLWLTGAYQKLPFFAGGSGVVTHAGKGSSTAAHVTPTATPTPVATPTPEPTPTPTPAPVTTVSCGEFTYESPHVGTAIILTLDGDFTFSLQTVLGGDVYLAKGTYQLSEGQVALTPEGDYYRDFMGDLSVGLFNIADDDTLTLLSPGTMGLMEAGESLTLTYAFDITASSGGAASPVASIQLVPILEERLGEVLTDAAREEIANTPSQNAFTTGLYLREDGQGFLLLDGSVGPESLRYLLYVVPGPSSGSKAGTYMSEGSADGSSELATVNGNSASDFNTDIYFALTSSGAIQVSSSWSEEEYIAYEAVDGLYYLYT